METREGHPEAPLPPLSTLQKGWEGVCAFPKGQPPTSTMGLQWGFWETIVKRLLPLPLPASILSLVGHVSYMP